MTVKDFFRLLLDAFILAAMIVGGILYLGHIEEIKHWYYMLVWGLD